MKKEQYSKNFLALKRIFDTAPCGYIVTNDDALILRINSSFCEWLGWEREELEGKKKFSDLLSLGGRMYFQTTHTPLSKLQGDVRELSYKMVSKTKERLPVLVSSTRQKAGKDEQILLRTLPDTDENLSIEYISQYIVFPFSDRQKFEIELLEAKKQAESAVEAKSIFLSTITHELRNPIHSILNAGNLLAAEELSEENQELLDIIRFSAQGLLEQVNSVLEISKMEAGNISLTETSFDLHKLLHRIVQSFRPQAEQKGLNLGWTVLSEAPLRFIGDGMKIRQVVTNLIGNAIKFTEKGSVQLVLDYNVNENELDFKVKDTGIGINPDIAEKIFTPFSQANDRIHSEFGGTGLGLSISQKILHAYDSQLEVTGVEGEGATFSFKLKLEPTDIIVSEPLLPILDMKPLSHLKVLVADDVKSNLIIIGRYFDKWNIEYDTADDGREAIDAILKNDYDLVFLDIGMPVVTGYDVAKHVRGRKEKKYAELPLLALTAYDRRDMESSVFECGMNGMLQKPFSKNELYHLICAHIPADEKGTEDLEEDIEEILKVDFSTLYDLFGEDKEDLKNYLQAAINDLNKTILDFEEAEKNLDLKLYKDAVHKLMSLSRMLVLKDLTALLVRQRQLLEEEKFSAFLEVGAERNLMMEQIVRAVQVEMGT